MLATIYVAMRENRANAALANRGSIFAQADRCGGILRAEPMASTLPVFVLYYIQWTMPLAFAGQVCLDKKVERPYF